MGLTRGWPVPARAITSLSIMTYGTALSNVIIYWALNAATGFENSKPIFSNFTQMSKPNKGNKLPEDDKGAETSQSDREGQMPDSKGKRRTRSGTVLEPAMDTGCQETKTNQSPSKLKGKGKNSSTPSKKGKAKAKKRLTKGKNNNATPVQSSLSEDESDRKQKASRSRSTKAKRMKFSNEKPDESVKTHKRGGKARKAYVPELTDSERDEFSSDSEVELKERSRSVGDGLNLEVDPGEDHYGESEVSSDEESEEGETSSSEDEQKADKTPVKDRGRKRYRESAERSPPRKRDRNDRGENNRNLALLKETPGLMELVEEIVEKRIADRSAGKSTKNASSRSRRKACESNTTVYTPALNKIGGEKDRMSRASTRMARLRINELTQDVNISPSVETGKQDEQGRGVTREDFLREEADQEIIDAERFKAAAANLPRGRSDLITPGRYDYSKDDQFFHATCHIEPSLVEKIQRGEFVELERLLNKALIDTKKDREEHRLDTVTREGQTYLIQGKEKDVKITGFRKWDKAFRVYAMIYSEANPSRSAEIMQYVEIISNAASTFVWDNVAQYDYTFRKLMAKNPQRSWARTHQNMWSIYLKEHNQKPGMPGNASSSKKGWRDNCCWKYNRDRCDKPAGMCRFEHRCSFCGSFSHIYLNCPKKPGKKPEKAKKREDKEKHADADSRTN